MMGRSHAISGIPAGLASAYAIGIENLALAVPYTMVTIGFALVPDLDHPNAAATRMLGPVGIGTSNALRRLSARVYESTKGPHDENWNGKHRHLSHTLVFALVVGLVTSGLCLLTPWAMVPVYALAVLLAADRIGDPMLLAGLAGAVIAAPSFLDSPTALSWQIGVAAAVGCFAHCLGDALTVGGCPFLWLPGPLSRLTTWAGESWYEIRLLGPLSFRTGSTTETWVAVPSLVGMGLMAAWLYVGPLVSDFREVLA